MIRTTGCPACESCQVFTYVNPSKCQGYSAVIGETPCTEEVGILQAVDDPIVFGYNDKNAEDGVTRFTAYDGKIYAGVVSCEVYHGERLSWKCNRKGQHNKCVKDGCTGDCLETGDVFMCHKYNSYAYGSARTPDFWTFRKDITNYLRRCSKWRFDYIDKQVAVWRNNRIEFEYQKHEVKVVNGDFDCMCKPVSENEFVYPFPVHSGLQGQPYRWAVAQFCGVMTCPAGQYASGCLMPRPSSIPSNDLLTLIGGENPKFNDCKNCVDGKYKTGTNQQTSCTTCSACPAGKVRTGCGASPWTSAGVCVNCAVGKYKSTPGAWDTVCIDCPTCPTNEMQNTEKCGVSPFTSTGTCECVPGYRRDNTGGTCVACEVDKYKDWIGDALGVPDSLDTNNGCNNCPTSMNTDTTGSTSITDCNCKTVRNKIQIGSQCIPCAFKTNYQQPVKEIGQPEVCQACPFDKYFVDPKCVPIPIMKLDCIANVLTLNPVEDKSKFVNEIITITIKSEHYLDLSSYTESSCDYCGTYRYADGCGRPESDGDKQYLWVRNSGTNQLFKQEFDANYLASTGPVTCALTNSAYVADASYTIERAGKCMDCTACTHANEYNLGCPQNQGICTSCEPTTPCDLTGQWYNHALADGCRDAQAITPYVCVDCVTWQKVNGDIMLIMGCAKIDYERWHPDVGETANTLTCVWDGSAWSGHSECVALTYDQYGSGIAIPYCPPDWFVDETCVSSQTTTTLWNSNCCKRCGASCRPAGETKKSASYSQCDGAGTDDTEICVQRCENGYYADQAEQQCKRCQMCGQT